jgi:hypothetical protein
VRRPLNNFADLCDSPRRIEDARVDAARYFTAFRFEVFLLAVLRAVFFAADFVFDFAFFAILPS